MAVFLSILKIIGLVLLWIIIILGVILCYLLFLPVHYDFTVKNQESHPFILRLRACGFIKFWQFSLNKTENEDICFSVSAFWGKLILFPRKKKTIGRDEQAKTKAQDLLEKNETEDGAGILDEEDIADIMENRDVSPMPENAEPEKTTGEKKEEAKNKKKNPKKPRAVLGKKIPGEFHKKWKDEHTKSAIQFLAKKVLWIIKKTKPKILNADAEFSLGDPALTGVATGAISLCPGCYGKKTKILPDFESEDIYFKGWIQIKGIVFFVHFVYLIGSVFFNKDCRSLIKK